MSSRPAARRRTHAPGILLLYHFSPPYASTVVEHADAIRRHSRYPTWSVNVDRGYPSGLDSIDPSVIVLHYSLFGSSQYLLSDQFLEFIDRARDSYKIAFFQDEYYYCAQRFAFIDRHHVDCVYTLLEPSHWDAVYGAHTYGPELVYTIPGYVSDDLVRLAGERGRPDARRGIDVGYRARSLPFYMGRGSQEKREIGIRFRELARNRGLALDIEVDEESRLYGGDWYAFVANCRAILGVEAGVSIFDIDDVVRTGAEALLAKSPGMGFDEMSRLLLEPWEDNIPYRTVSPRHFEAAAFRVVQILFEGRYSGVLEPMTHYLPLRKDFSNLDEILRLLGDAEVRRTITDRAHADLIASDRYSYRAFVRDFDAALERRGLDLAPDAVAAHEMRRRLAEGALGRWIRSELRLRRRALGRRPAISRARQALRSVIGR